MAGKFDAHAFSKGDIMRRQAETDRELRSQQTARRLEAAAVGRGGMRVHRGGQFVLDDLAGTRSFTAASDGIFVHNGASINALDGGSIRALYESGTTAALWGSLVNTSSGSSSGHGILVQDIDESDIFRALRRPNGLTAVYVGMSENDVPVPIDELSTRAASTRIRNYGSKAWLESWEPGGDIGLWSDEGEVTIGGNQARVITAYQGTTDPANCHLGVDGLIHRVSSSRRYKNDIQDFSAPAADVLRLRPRTWLPAQNIPSGGPVGPGGREPSPRQRLPGSAKQPQRRQVGLVAEEVAAVIPELVSRTPSGEPESVAYDRIAVALLGVVRQQQQQIEDLRTRLSVIEAAGPSGTP